MIVNGLPMAEDTLQRHMNDLWKANGNHIYEQILVKMKILNSDEADGLEPLGKGKYNWLYKRLMLIAVGEAIVIHYDDWKGKSTPYKTIRTAAKNLKRDFNYGRHPDGSGWLVKRVK